MFNTAQIRQNIQNLARCERGTSAIEFAVIASFLMIVLLNIFDIGLYMFHKMEVTSSARAGAQYALVDMTNATPALITNVVENATNLTGLDVTVVNTMCGCSDGGTLFTCGTSTCGEGTTGRIHSYTQISADYTHVWLFYPGTTTITANNTIRTQ
ncbi:MAG: pilus assembly protein [Magnetovibrio sp.]|nr:pilus assembly protein [Magnetovibrio sp.]